MSDRWKRKGKKDKKKQMGGASYSESVRTKWFCCRFKFDFVQLMYKASLIFKANLELPLPIILKVGELHESKQCGGV